MMKNQDGTNHFDLDYSSSASRSRSKTFDDTDIFLPDVNRLIDDFVNDVSFNFGDFEGKHSPQSTINNENSSDSHHPDRYQTSPNAIDWRQERSYSSSTSSTTTSPGEQSIDSCYFSSGEVSSSTASTSEPEEDYNQPEDEHWKRLPILIMSFHSSFVCGELTRRLHKAWFYKSDKNYKDKSVTSISTTDISDASITGRTSLIKLNCSPDVIPNNGNNIHQKNNSSNFNNNPSAFQRRLIKEIQSKFHQVDLFPTESQVFEMIQFASKCSRRRTLHSISTSAAALTSDTSNCEQSEQSETGLTFGEFCFFASILINSAKTPQSRPLVSNHALFQCSENVETLAAAAHYNRNNNNNNGHHSFPHLRSHCHPIHHRSSLVDYNISATKFDIFLGGSCNPTRWRSDLVMPELKKNCITYYNPQVDHWGPELIELESFAKQNSEVLFFVIDNQTRAIASMIEVAFIAASSRKLILVINDFEPWSEKIQICEDHILKEEYETLRRGRQFLRDIVERQEIPIFGDIPKALRSAIQVLHENVRPQDLSASDDVTPVKNGHVSLGDKMIQLYHVYNQLKISTKEFTMAELSFAYLMFTRREIPPSLLEQIVRYHCYRKSGDLTILPTLDKIPIDFNDFCIIISELEIAFTQINQENEVNESTGYYHEYDERISEASETTETTGRGSFTTSVTTASTSETDSDNYQYFNKNNRYTKRESKKKKKMNRKSSNEITAFSTSHLSLRLIDKFSNLVNAFKTLILDSGIIIEQHQQQEQQDQEVNKRKKKHQKQNSHHKKLLPNTHRGKKDIEPGDSLRILETRTIDTPPPTMDPQYIPEEYLIKKSSSQSLNQLNDFYHYQPYCNPIHTSSYHHHRYDSYHRNSVSPFRKSSSPRNFASLSSSTCFVDQPTTTNNNIGGDFRRRSYHQYHRSSTTFIPQFPPTQPQKHQQKQGINNNLHMISSSQSSMTSLLYETVYDLYLGGCLNEKIMQDKVIPLLKKKSLSYCTPKFDKLAKHERLIPLEALNIEKCRRLLFVIPGDSLDISSMIIAAYYVGLGYRVVLCIQYIDPVNSKLAFKLSSKAIKDYNRGRSYLSDMATKSHVPVFENLDEAIECCTRE